MRNKYIYLAILGILFEVIAIFLLFNKWKDQDQISGNSLNSYSRQQLSSDLNDSMELSGNWFKEIQNNQGDFTYQIDTKTAQPADDNNIVRQAGSLYSLAQLYKVDKDPSTKEMLDKGFAYFDILIQSKGEDKSAVVYDNRTKSNTTALLLLALVEYAEGTNSNDFELIQRLSNYLVFTQTDAGDFVNEYLDTSEVSDYNNGETFYALIRSYILIKDPVYLASVKKAADYFKTTYSKQEFNSGFFSWGMAGFAYLYNTSQDSSDWDFLEAYYLKYLNSRGNSIQICIIGKGQSCTKPGVAVFLEGVAHIGWIAKDKDSKLYKDIRTHLELTLNDLLKYQIGGNHSSFNFREQTLQGATCADVACSYTRIDYTQHQLSASYLYLKFI